MATKDGDVGDAAVDNGTGDAGMVRTAMATLMTVVPAVELATRRAVTLAGGLSWRRRSAALLMASGLCMIPVPPYPHPRRGRWRRRSWERRRRRCGRCCGVDNGDDDDGDAGDSGDGDGDEDGDHDVGDGDEDQGDG